MRGLWAGVLATVLGAGAPSAQQLPAVAPEEGAAAVPQSNVLLLRQEALFEQSAYGKASIARIEAANAALLAENRQIEAALEAEERDLTARRAMLPAAEFRALAEAFDAKVEGIRNAQESKGRAISRSRDEDRQRFFAAVLPILAQIMRESGAAVILDDDAVILSFDRVDITAIAVARVDAAIGTGEGLAAAPEGAPETVPGAPTAP